MADVTNTLTTVLRVTGAGQMASAFSQGTQLLKTFGLAQEATGLAGVRLAEIQGRLASETAAANSIRQFAIIATQGMTAAQAAANPIMAQLTAAEQAAAVAAGELSAAQTAALGPLLLVVGVIAVLTAAIAVAVKGLQTFAEESQKAFQAAVVFKNLGLQTTPAQLQAQVGAVSQATGFRRPELLESAGKLASAGLQPQQIQTALKTIGDTARATGKDFDQVGNAVERAILGKTRGLAQFGIVFQDTGSKAANFARTMQELNLRFEGASEAFKNTLPGAVENFQNSLQHLFSVIGERLAPVAIKVLNFMATVIDFIADHIDAVLAVINPVLFGMLQLMGKGGDNPMAKVGHGGDPASERTAREIADNTKRAADSVEQQILGGAGTEVRGAFSHLQARLALAI